METLYRAGLSNAATATVLALAVGCLSRPLSRRPAILHCLWMLVLLKLVTPPLFEVSIPWPEQSRVASAVPNTPETRVAALNIEPAGDRGDSFVVELSEEQLEEAVLATESTATAPRWTPDDWMRMACLIWISGTAMSLAVAAARIVRFRRHLRDLIPVEQDTQDWVDDLAHGLGIDRTPSVWWTDGKLPPLVWSLSWRPRIVIPHSLWKGLDQRQRSTLIVHELAHIRRGDHFVRFFELIVSALFWWHPVLWWARHALREVEEQCCDAWVVWACPDAAKSYAETLLETLDFLNQSDLREPLLASGFGKVNHLRKRLTMIMSGNTPRLVGFWGTLGSLGIAATLLPLNATWAQKADEPAEVRFVVKSDLVKADTQKPAAITIVEDEPTEVRFVVKSDLVTEGTQLPEGVTVVSDVSDLATVVSDGAEARTDEFHFEFKTDDGAAVVVGGPPKEAIEKLKELIKSTEKEGGSSDAVRAKKLALEKAVKEIEEIGAKQAKVKSDKADVQKKKAEQVARKVFVKSLTENVKLSDEQKAEAEKIKAQIQKLSDEMRTKQRELGEARAKLGKLIASSRNTGGAAVTLRGDVRLKDVKLGEARSLGIDRKNPVVVKRDGGDSARNQKRLEDLEKKLSQLLDEFASLKKERAK